MGGAFRGASGGRRAAALRAARRELRVAGTGRVCMTGTRAAASVGAGGRAAAGCVALAATRRRTSCQISMGLLRFGRNGGVRARYRRGCCGGGAWRLRGRRWRVQATIPRSAPRQGSPAGPPQSVNSRAGTRGADIWHQRRAGAAKAARRRGESAAASGGVRTLDGEGPAPPAAAAVGWLPD